MSMKQPQLKRRRLLSNTLVPLLTPNPLPASLKPSRMSTCTLCHRMISLKSGPPLVCARCGASTCAICMRTCTGEPPSSSRGTDTRNPSPCRSPSLPPLGNSDTASSSRRRRARDDDIDTILRAIGLEREGTGCGRTICRKCCLEIPQSETVACLDCFAAHRVQAGGSGVLMQEATTDNVLIAST